MMVTRNRLILVVALGLLIAPAAFSKKASCPADAEYGCIVGFNGNDAPHFNSDWKRIGKIKAKTFKFPLVLTEAVSKDGKVIVSYEETTYRFRRSYVELDAKATNIVSCPKEMQTSSTSDDRLGGTRAGSSELCDVDD